MRRRSWLQKTSVSLAGMTAASYARAAGANERVRAAVIGLGGQGKVHVAGWKSQPHATLVGVCDIDSGRLRDVAQADANLKAEIDLRRILDDTSIDVVSIATPDHWHAPAALLALAAGKHVYVEKPCAHNFREGQALVAGAAVVERHREGGALQPGAGRQGGGTGPPHQGAQPRGPIPLDLGLGPRGPQHQAAPRGEDGEQGESRRNAPHQGSSNGRRQLGSVAWARTLGPR